MIWFEVVGYAGAAATIVSLGVRSRVKMRWFGIAGGLLLALYGVLIGAWPITIAGSDSPRCKASPMTVRSASAALAD